VGCEDGDCHYLRGTYLGRSKVALLDTVLGQMSAIESGVRMAPQRVRFTRLTAYDRYVLPRLIDEFSAEIEALAPASAPARA
jgi:coenzyme F420-reducing hydrogenase delta subunit